MNRDIGPLNNGESSAWKEENPGNVIDVTADSFPPLLVKSENKSNNEENLKKSYASVVSVDLEKMHVICWFRTCSLKL